jgi:hypothetical protein
MCHFITASLLHWTERRQMPRGWKRKRESRVERWVWSALAAACSTECFHWESNWNWVSGAFLCALVQSQTRALSSTLNHTYTYCTVKYTESNVYILHCQAHWIKRIHIALSSTLNHTFTYCTVKYTESNVNNSTVKYTESNVNNSIVKHIESHVYILHCQAHWIKREQ